VRVLLAAALVLFALACQRETPDVSQNDPSKSSTAAGSPQEAPPQSGSVSPPLNQQKDEPAGAATPASPTQEVHLIEYMVHMPATLSAGRTGFNVENGGKEDHGFVIEGNGIHEESVVLKTGGTASVTVDLKPGTYTVYCPVKDHAQKGMKTTVTVR
jgi:plastocyanin